MKITDNIYLVASGKWGFGITQAIDCNVFLISSSIPAPGWSRKRWMP